MVPSGNDDTTNAAAGQALEAGWRCFIQSRSATGAGRNRHTQYRALGQGPGRPQQEVQFRFSDLVRLRAALAQNPELQGLTLPSLPPKVTLRSTFLGQFDVAFQDERQRQVQQFIDQLGVTLSSKYAGFGDYVELCEPFQQFIQRATEGCVAAEVAAAAAAADVARNIEDRQIRADQDAEYEEALRADELRAIAQVEEEEERRKEQQRQEEERLRQRLEGEAEIERLAKAEQEAAEDIRKRRVTFEEAHPAPQAGVPAAAVRFRAACGASTTRSFAATAPVTALFEYVAVHDWAGAPPCSGDKYAFDLRTTHPVRSLRDTQNLTLEEAKLCPNTALVVAVDEPPTPNGDGEVTTDCEWMFGDAATGWLGLNALADLNPLRWSGSRTIAKAVEELRAVHEQGDRPIIVKVPSGIRSREVKLSSIDEAINHLEAASRPFKMDEH
jgi:hypothetical protein